MLLLRANGATARLSLFLSGRHSIKVPFRNRDRDAFAISSWSKNRPKMLTSLAQKRGTVCDAIADAFRRDASVDNRPPRWILFLIHVSTVKLLMLSLTLISKS